jgi:glycerophosphoryl diester phosphodiesterase
MFSTSGHPLVIAHRGASGHAPENSIEAFRKAEELRADGVELDVHATSDGTIIVFHDACLPSGESISETPAAKLREHRLANGETIPLLSEVLAAIPGLKVFIEVKHLDTRWDSALLKVIATGNPERCAVHSFDHRVVARLAALRPTLACGALSVARLVDPVHALDRALADTLWQEADYIDPALVQQVHDSNRRVFAWTINDADTAHRLTRMGVDGLCGNFPERLGPSRR